ncbi:MAG: hypothetical protein ACRDOO_22095 [Actinomadura sp.]
MGDGFSVNLDALKNAGLGVSELMAELNRRGVDEIDCEGSAVGHDRLAAVISSFCDRWQVGVENLTEDGEQLAHNLIDSAGRYLVAEQSAVRAIEAVAASFDDGSAAPMSGRADG